MRRRSSSKSSMGRVVVWALFVCVLGGLAIVKLGILPRPHGLLDRLDVSYVIVNLAGGKYSVNPELASGNDRSEFFSSMVNRLKPYAAICGTYYDTEYKPLGDIVVNGKRVCKGRQRQGVGFTRSGRIVFIERKGRARIDWSGCVSGIACGPRLVREGRECLNVKRDGFHPAAGTNKAWRCAVGRTPGGKLILCAVAESITLSTLAEVMIELGADDAVNLDGGSMCAFYEKGKIRVHPAMPMSNILAVYKAK